MRMKRAASWFRDFQREQNDLTFLNRVYGLIAIISVPVMLFDSRGKYILAFGFGALLINTIVVVISNMLFRRKRGDFGADALDK